MRKWQLEFRDCVIQFPFKIIQHEYKTKRVSKKPLKSEYINNVVFQYECELRDLRNEPLVNNVDFNDQL